MEEDFDIYEDLDDFGKKNNGTNALTDKSTAELLNELKQLEEKVKTLDKKLVNEKNCRKTLETNLSSLLKTAKTELSRKDRIISELRQQLDAMCFRRNKFKIPKIDKPDEKKIIEDTNKDPKVNEEQEISNNSDKSLPEYFSAQKYISPLSALSDEEGIEEITHSKQPAMTVYGKRLTIKLKHQEEQEKLQVEQSKLLHLNSNTNGVVVNKIEVEDTKPENVDNKENQYRLISLDINLPKKTIKRPHEDNFEEILDKRKKLNETCGSSYKNKNIDHVDKTENSASCIDKFIETTIINSEYSCCIPSKNDKLKIEKQTKKLENDRRVHSSRNIGDKRDDRYNKNNKDEKSRSKSRSRRTESEKTYSNDNKSRRYDSRHYDREDTFNRRNRSKSRTDLRNQLNKKKNDTVRNNDLNEKNYSEEKSHGEVRRSRRIEEKSHNRHLDYKKNNDNYNRDNYKNRQPYEEKGRTKRRSKSRDNSREKKKIIEKDLMSVNKIEIKHSEILEVNQTPFDEEIEEGEIVDCSTDNLGNSVDNIFEQSVGIPTYGTSKLHTQSPKEERIENIRDFIQTFEADEIVEEIKNENVDENKNNSPQNLEKSPCNHHDECSDDKLELIQKHDVIKTILEQECNIDIEKIEECHNENKNVNEKIIMEDNQLPSNVDINPLLNTIDFEKNEAINNENKVIKNNDENIEHAEEIQQVSIEKESKTKEKPKIIQIDDLTNIKDPVYNSLLEKYLTNKVHSNKITINANLPIDHGNSKEILHNDLNEIHSEIETNNLETINSENVEVYKYEKSQNEIPSICVSEDSVKINPALDKSIILSSSLGSSVLRSDDELRKSSDLLNNEVNNDNDIFIIGKNTSDQNINESNSDEKPNTSVESEKKNTSASKRKKGKVDENKVSHETNIIIINKRRRPVRLSDFSSP